MNAILFLLSLGTSLVCDWTAGTPQVVDAPITPGLWIAIATQFVLWILGMYAWGKILCVRAKLTGAATALALGSLLYAFLGFVLAALGFLYPWLRFPLWIFQAAGIAIAPRSRLERRTALPFLPLALPFFLLFLDALAISSYWDPLHHHLTSIRLFWEKGHLYFPSEAIASYQEGAFELLFLWPHFFFAQAQGKGLLPVQIFAQLTHLCIGFGGSLLVAHALARRWLPHTAWIAIALLLFAAPLSLQISIPTAKNDWGIIFWVLAGFSIAETAPLAAGLLLGFAWIGKLSAVYALTGLGTLVFFSKEPRRHWAKLVTGFALGALPLALRNLIGTGNPLFPLFHTQLGPSWREAMVRYAQTPLGFGRLQEWAAEFPLRHLVLAVPTLALFRKEGALLRSAAFGVFAGTLFFSFSAGQAVELRLLGTLLPMAGLLAAVLLQRLAAKLPVTPTWLPYCLVLLLALLLPYRWSALARAQLLPQNHLAVRSYISAEAQGWFRDHYSLGMKAALLAESRTYHSLPFPIVRIWDAPAIDTKLRATTGPKDFFHALESEGFTHLILSQEKLDIFYPAALVSQIEGFVLAYPESFAFQTQYSIVADIEKLEQAAGN